MHFCISKLFSRLFNHLVLLVLIAALSACTGNNGPKSDAEGFLGRIKTFVYVHSPTKATVISVAPTSENAWKSLYDASAGLTELGEVPFQQVKISNDQKFLTLSGDPLIFQSLEVEKKDLSPAALAKVESPIESICIPLTQDGLIGPGGHKEIQFKNVENQLKSFGWKQDSLEILGNVTRQDLPFETRFQVQNYGQFQIDLTQPMSTGSYYYKTTLTSFTGGTPSSLYCHLDKRASHKIFVTSNRFSANFGGLPGADALCASAANAGGLPGNWKAILSTSTSKPQDRLVIAGPISQVGGSSIVATEASALWGLTATVAPLLVPVNRDEFGNEVSSESKAWTGSLFASSPYETCLDWTSNSNGYEVKVGLAHAVDSYWLSNFTIGFTPTCGDDYRLYCITQP